MSKVWYDYSKGVMLYLWIRLIIQANFQQRLGNRMCFFHAQFIFSSEWVFWPIFKFVDTCCLKEELMQPGWNGVVPVNECRGLWTTDIKHTTSLLWHAALKDKSPLKLELILVNWYYPINSYLEVLDRCYWSYFNKSFIGVRILHIFSMNYHFFCCI